MKWYQPIECDNTVKNPLVCDYDNLESFGFNENCFKKGKTIGCWQSETFFQSKKRKNDGQPDDVLQNHLMLPIYSTRLVNLLSHAIEGIQYLPIRVIQSNGQPIEGFYIANILNCIEALDYSKSDYSLFSEDFPNPNVRGKIARVRKFVLRQSKIEGYDIIRLKEYKQSFIVSERFREIFSRNKFTGYSFKEIQVM